MNQSDFILDAIKNIKIKKIIIDKDGLCYINYISKKNGWLFQQDLKSRYLWVSHWRIWQILENKYDMNDTEIQELIKNMVEKHLKIKGFIPANGGIVRSQLLTFMVGGIT